MVDATAIADDRPLTPSEAALIRWLLEHGTPEAAGFISQVEQVRVASKCSCGCASIDFSVSGRRPPQEVGLQILADYVWKNAESNVFGVFVFAKGGVLAGLELWSVDGQAPASSLPAIEVLRPLVQGSSS